MDSLKKILAIQIADTNKVMMLHSAAKKISIQIFDKDHHVEMTIKDEGFHLVMDMAISKVTKL